MATIMIMAQGAMNTDDYGIRGIIYACFGREFYGSPFGKYRKLFSVTGNQQKKHDRMLAWTEATPGMFFRLVSINQANGILDLFNFLTSAKDYEWQMWM